MVVCRYYLQGTCRFGTNCKFDHIVGGQHQQGEGTSIMRKTAPNGATIDAGTLVKSVQTDMLNGEKGGQWLFSSYAPFKEKPCFPGFEDKSFEEVRLGFYEATAGGTIDEFKRQLQSAQDDVVTKIRALQNPNDEAVKTLQAIYNTPTGQGTSAQTQGPIFSQNLTFGPQTPPRGSIFGPPPPATGSIFGGPPPTQGSIFAQAAQNYLPQQAASQQTSIFTLPALSPFGLPQPQAANTGNIFAQAAVNHNPSGSIFGGGATTGSIFAPQPVPQLQPAPTNIFHQQQPAQQVSNSPFGGSHLTNSIFNQGQTHNNIFHQAAQTAASRNRCVDFYTDINLLSKTDAKEYKNDLFDIGKVPNQPPPLEVCF